jgi:hypothetical protein
MKKTMIALRIALMAMWITMGITALVTRRTLSFGEGAMLAFLLAGHNVLEAFLFFDQN